MPADGSGPRGGPLRTGKPVSDGVGSALSTIEGDATLEFGGERTEGPSPDSGSGV